MFIFRYIPAFAIAIAFTFDGMIPFYSLANTISKFGLSNHFASLPITKVIIIVNKARNTILVLVI